MGYSNEGGVVDTAGGDDGAEQEKKDSDAEDEPGMDMQDLGDMQSLEHQESLGDDEDTTEQMYLSKDAIEERKEYGHNRNFCDIFSPFPRCWMMRKNGNKFMQFYRAKICILRAHRCCMRCNMCFYF